MAKLSEKRKIYAEVTGAHIDVIVQQTLINRSPGEARSIDMTKRNKARTDNEDAVQN